MELALICAQQVIVLFLLIGVGTLAVKTGVLKLEHKQPLSNLLVNIVVPAMIVNSYQMEFSLEILRNLLAAFGLSILTIALGTVLTLALTARRKNSRTAIFRFASIFSNAAYMGFPLISALFGSEGLLYASAYVTVFNVLLWTLGYSMVSGSSDPKEPGPHPGHLRCPGRPGHLPPANPHPCPAGPAHLPAGCHEHPSFHAHHRNADRGGRFKEHRLQPPHLETGRHADAGHPGPLPWGLCSAGAVPLRDGRTGRAAARVLPRRCHHLGVCGAVRPR